jgi:hypothetical protein
MACLTLLPSQTLGGLSRVAHQKWTHAALAFGKSPIGNPRKNQRVWSLDPRGDKSPQSRQKAAHEVSRFRPLTSRAALWKSAAKVLKTGRVLGNESFVS